MFLSEALIFSVIMFTVPYMVNSEKAGTIAWDISEAFVAWSCGMTALGYAKQYLNKNNRFRKLANEAIYPFYLLHQPVIVAVGYFIVRWDVAITWKVLSITIFSLLITIVMYWFLVRPFNAMRLIFGMKLIRKEKQLLKPVRIQGLITETVKK